MTHFEDDNAVRIQGGSVQAADLRRRRPSPARTRTQWIAGMLAAVGAALLLPAACDDSSESAAPQKSPAEQLCEQMAAQLQACGPVTPCDGAIVQDCAGLVGSLSEGMIAHLDSCLKAGGAVLGCLVGSVDGLAPTAAHTVFAGKFCDTCTGGIGVDECKAALFGGESSFEVGAVLLPFSDAIVDEISANCITDMLACANILTCVQTTLAKRAIPTETLACLVDALAHPASVPASPGCGAGGGGQGGSGQGGSGQGGSGQGGSGQGGSGQGGSGQGGSGTMDCYEQCAATYSGGIDDLNILLDCTYCGACYDACDGDINCSGGQELGCSVDYFADCAGCTGSFCALNDVCHLEYVACMDNNDCFSLNNCYINCS